MPMLTGHPDGWWMDPDLIPRPVISFGVDMPIDKRGAAKPVAERRKLGRRGPSGGDLIVDLRGTEQRADYSGEQGEYRGHQRVVLRQHFPRRQGSCVGFLTVSPEHPPRSFPAP